MVQVFAALGMFVGGSVALLSAWRCWCSFANSVGADDDGLKKSDEALAFSWLAMHVGSLLLAVVSGLVVLITDR